MLGYLDLGFCQRVIAGREHHYVMSLGLGGIGELGEIRLILAF